MGWGSREVGGGGRKLRNPEENNSSFEIFTDYS